MAPFYEDMAPTSTDYDIAVVQSIYGAPGGAVTTTTTSSPTISGTSGADTIYGGSGADTIYGGDGDDLIYGNMGADLLWGGDGNDTLYGGQDNDHLYGGRGNDLLFGNLGADRLPLQCRQRRRRGPRHHRRLERRRHAGALEHVDRLDDGPRRPDLDPAVQRHVDRHHRRQVRRRAVPAADLNSNRRRFADSRRGEAARLSGRDREARLLRRQGGQEVGGIEDGAGGLGPDAPDPAVENALNGLADKRGREAIDVPARRGDPP